MAAKKPNKVEIPPDLMQTIERALYRYEVWIIDESRWELSIKAVTLADIKQVRNVLAGRDRFDGGEND